MKLELKHLAPYLPYDLMLQEKARPRFQNGDHVFSVEKWVGRDIARPFVKRHGIVWCKPILRPLSNLFKVDNSIDRDELSLYALEHIESSLALGIDENQSYVDNIPFEMAQYLISKHYDIYGLIKEGKAIDINTL